MELLKLQSKSKLGSVRGIGRGESECSPLLPSTSRAPSGGYHPSGAPTPLPRAVGPKTQEQMKSMTETGNAQNILSVVQSESNVAPPELLLHIVKSGGGRADQRQVSKSPSSPGRPSPGGSQPDLSRDPNPATHHYIRMPVPREAGSARSLAHATKGKAEEDLATTLVNPNQLLNDGPLDHASPGQAHQIEPIAQVIQEQTVSGESSVVQEGPTPRQTPGNPYPNISPAQLSFSVDCVQGEPVAYLGLPLEPLGAGGSEAPATP